MALNNEMDIALQSLQNNGYTHHFIKLNQYIYCLEKKLNFISWELNITEKFRYENKLEPGSNNVLYAVEAPEYGIKGFLMN